MVDTRSAAPRVVRAAARRFAGRAGASVYVSSRSVYAFPAAPGADEDARIVDASPADGDVEYARAKADGELAVTETFGPHPRPHEDVGRLPWWLNRIAADGRAQCQALPS